MYQKTTATTKIFDLNKRIRAVCGGTSASKTVSILIYLIDYAIAKPNTSISVVSESFPHLKRGAIRDFTEIMKDHGYWHESLWNATDKMFQFPNGSFIEFFSADQPDKVRGPRRHILFINECNNVPYETFDQLEIRTRDQIWLDWNPTNEFWFYDKVKERDDVDFITLTYKDNEALDEQIVKSIESHKENRNWWQVYGLGQLGDVEGKIYRNWPIIDDIPEEARLERYCIDFGYSLDPTAIIAIYYWNNAFILDELMYNKGLSNKQIADVILNQGQDVVTVADSAEPKSIDELRMYGVAAIPARKGKDSILNGILHVQSQKIFVTKRSTNVIKENRNYMWKRFPNGRIDGRHPEDVFNHAMDALRYGLETLRPTYQMTEPVKIKTTHQLILEQIGTSSRSDEILGDMY